MSDREARLAESRNVSRMLVQLGERAKSDFAATVAPFELPVPLVRALLVLAEPTSMRDMAEQLACDPSYITGIADQLEDRGLVTRAPGRDRRVKLLEVTPAGRELRERMATVATDRTLITERLSDDDRATLVRLLEALLHPDTEGESA
jgi:DNA-binding MarR family transcriptional regulator